MAYRPMCQFLITKPQGGPSGTQLRPGRAFIACANYRSWALLLKVAAISTSLMVFLLLIALRFCA